MTQGGHRRRKDQRAGARRPDRACMARAAVASVGRQAASARLRRRSASQFGIWMEHGGEEGRRRGTSLGARSALPFLSPRFVRRSFTQHSAICEEEASMGDLLQSSLSLSCVHGDRRCASTSGASRSRAPLERSVRAGRRLGAGADGFAESGEIPRHGIGLARVVEQDVTRAQRARGMDVQPELDHRAGESYVWIGGRECGRPFVMNDGFNHRAGKSHSSRASFHAISELERTHGALPGCR